MNRRRRVCGLCVVFLAAVWAASARVLAGPDAGASFDGAYYSGKGDVEYLELLDFSRRVFDPGPAYQHLAMLYTPAWNGLVEGPTWGAWWVQNSYGPSYCALPFLQEPFVTFLQNSQDLWFDQMGDGKTPRPFGKFDFTPPDGCLCDAASPGRFIAKQGDGRVEIHDWGMEFTAAGLLLQAEALLIRRDLEAVARYLPKLRRCAAFVESRRDPKNDLFLAGPAGNLLAPSYAGCKNPDGSYGQAYLVGLSVTYIAALDRLIELERLVGHDDQARLDVQRRDRARAALALATTSEGYLIKSLDPDGTRHGVYGAAKHGYFEAVCNHDAIAFRVVDDAQSRAIYAKLASIPGLRPHDLIITNYPSLDDMYERPEGLWEFGRWVNGGHWTTCEARMILAYNRLGAYDDVRRSMRKIRDYFRRFRTDNPLVDFGGDVYQPNEPINCVYDAWGAPAAMIRGLFEYIYSAESLTIHPHVPVEITELHQRFPIRFGSKRLYLSTIGSGPVTGATVDGRPLSSVDSASVVLPYDAMPAEARIQVLLGGAAPVPHPPGPHDGLAPTDALSRLDGLARTPEAEADLKALESHLVRIRRFHAAMAAAGLAESYETAHARLAIQCAAAGSDRARLLAEGSLPRLPEASQLAADHSYIASALRVSDGLGKALDGYETSDEPRKQRIFAIWAQAAEDQTGAAAHSPQGLEQGPAP